jgi:hypothetical protein
VGWNAGTGLRQDRVTVDADAVAALSPDDHRRVFATSMAVLVAEFGAYLDGENANPVTDLVGYRQHAVWLSRNELTEMIGKLRRVILQTAHRRLQVAERISARRRFPNSWQSPVA